MRAFSANISCLKNWETALTEAVKCAPLGVFAGGEAAAENLHSEQREYEDKQNKEDEQRVDWGDGVHQGLYQVAHGAPVSEVQVKY